MHHSSRLPAGLTQQMLREEPLPEGTLDLTQSNPHACALDAPVVLADFLPQVRPGYCPEPLGHGDGRRSVAAQMGHWGRPTDPAAVMLTSSTSENARSGAAAAKASASASRRTVPTTR